MSQQDAEPPWRHRSRDARRLLAAAALAALPALGGCDIVQGFQDAGDALFPEQSTHLSSPALRLVSGPYTRIGLIAGRELSVLARSADAADSLFVMRFANPHPCEIPAVGRFVASGNPNRPEAGIAYFHEDAAQGTLHFADTSCKVYDLEIENARLPLGETERTVIVWAGGDLLEVDPERQEQTTLDSGVTGIVTRAYSGRTLVLTAGHLDVRDGEWKSQGTFGNGVGAVAKTSNGVLYLDASGLRQLSWSADDKSATDQLVMADACDLGLRDGTWATFHAPCSERRLRALHLPSGSVYDLDFDADPQNLLLVPARGGKGKSPVDDPFWFLFLRDGSLIVREPSGDEKVIGPSATLDRAAFYQTGSETYGYAFTNIAGNVGDYVYWSADQPPHTLAHDVLTGGQRLLVNWNGSSGDLAVASGDRLVTVAHGVPSKGFEFPDERGAWTLIFHDLQGDRGRISRFAGTLDSLESTPTDAAFTSPQLEEVAPSVGLYTAASLGSLIPGAAFLADYDAANDTGLLTYENAELRFKANVDAGVSDYIVTSTDLLYCIPQGPKQGIWLASGK